MKAVFVQQGHAIDFVPEHDVEAGEILVCNGIAGIVRLSVKAGELGALHLSGVYDVGKDKVAFKAGSCVFFNTATKLATASSTASNVFLGIASASSEATSQVVRVILNFGHPAMCGGDSSSGISWNTLP